MSLRAEFFAFDDALARNGVPSLTAWWRDGIGTWLDAYEAGGPLELWACVGRGAAKSTALYKLATFFTLFGDVTVPPGERHFAIVLSRLKEEAAKGIAIIGAWLRMLGVPHRPSGDVIELDDMPRGIRVVAASVAGTSGWRAFFVGKDERGKWPVSGVDERDAEEIDTSAAAMTATHSRAPILTFGSAWITLGAFHESIEAGSTDARRVLGPTPTWVAAPHITEADCRRKEPDPKRFAREYASIAADAHDEALLDAAAVERAMRATSSDVPPERGVAYTAAIDPSLGRNAFTLVVAGARLVDERTKASVVLHREWRAEPGKALDPAAALMAVASHVRPYGVTEVRTDAYHAESLNAICERMQLGIRLLIDKPTAAQKLARYEGLAMRCLDDAIELPRDAVVKRDLLGIKRRMSAGLDSFVVSLATTADGRHCDFAPAVALAVERISIDEATPEWMRAMQALALGGPKPAGAVVKCRTMPDGRYEAWGEPPAFAPGEAARFHTFGEATFSQQATDKFRTALTAYRSAHNL